MIPQCHGIKKSADQGFAEALRSLSPYDFQGARNKKKILFSPIVG